MSSRFTDAPVNRLFGFELLDIDGRGASVAFRPRAEHAQEYGVVHGGILSALADTAAVYTILPGLKPGERTHGNRRPQRLRQEIADRRSVSSGAFFP